MRAHRKLNFSPEEIGGIKNLLSDIYLLTCGSFDITVSDKILGKLEEIELVLNDGVG